MRGLVGQHQNGLICVLNPHRSRLNHVPTSSYFHLLYFHFGSLRIEILFVSNRAPLLLLLKSACTTVNLLVGGGLGVPLLFILRKLLDKLIIVTSGQRRFWVVCAVLSGIELHSACQLVEGYQFAQLTFIRTNCLRLAH